MNIRPLVSGALAAGRAGLRAAIVAGLIDPPPPDPGDSLAEVIRYGLWAAVPVDGQALAVHGALTDALYLDVYFCDLRSFVIGPGEALLAGVHPLFLPSIFAQLEVLHRLPRVFSPFTAWQFALDAYVGDEHLQRWRRALAQQRHVSGDLVSDASVWRHVDREGAMTRPAVERELGVWSSRFRALSWRQVQRLAQAARGEAGHLARRVLDQTRLLARLHAQIHPDDTPASRAGAAFWTQEYRQYAMGAYRQADDLVEELHGEADEWLGNSTRGNPTAEVAVTVTDLKGARRARRSVFAYAQAHEAWEVLLHNLTAAGLASLAEPAALAAD